MDWWGVEIVECVLGYDSCDFGVDIYMVLVFFGGDQVVGFYDGLDDSIGIEWMDGVQVDDFG